MFAPSLLVHLRPHGPSTACPRTVNVLARTRRLTGLILAMTSFAGTCAAQSALASAAQLGSLPGNLSPDMVQRAMSAGFSPGALPANAQIPADLRSAAGAFDTAPLLMLDAPINWGPFSVRPRLSYSLNYNNGLPIAPGVRGDTYVDAYAAGFILTGGERLVLDYSASKSVYSRGDFKDAIDHQLQFFSTLNPGNVRISFVQSYAMESSPRLETFTQVKQQTSATSVTATYALGEEGSIEAFGTQVLSFVEQAVDPYSWSGGLRARYRPTEKSSAGVGYRVAYVATPRRADSISVGPQIQATWQPTGRLSFDATIGSNERYTYKTGISKSVQTDLQTSLSWRPFETTSISASASRDLSPSVLTGGNRGDVTWSVALTQRLLQHLALNLGYSEQKSRFLEEDVDLAPNRVDTISVFSASIGTTVLRRLNLNANYQWTVNASDDIAFDYDSEQIGFSASWSY